MARILVPLVVVLMVISACSGAAPAPQAAAPVEVTRLVQVTVPAAEVTRLVEVTRVAEVTRVVEVTAPPVVVTATPEPSPTPLAAIPRIKLTQAQTIDIGGVKLTVQDLALADMVRAAQDPNVQKLRTMAAFEKAQVMGLISLALENGAAGKVNIYADQGILVVGSEQVELSSFMLYGDGDVGGEFFAGVKSEGTVMFGLDRTKWQDIAGGTTVIFEVPAPSDEKYTSLGKQPYRFELELKPEK